MVDMRTDQELMGAYCDGGDQSAFAELYSRYAKLVYSVCFRCLRNNADAEDATTACFVVFMKRIQGLRARPKLSAWMFWCATGVSMDAVRARQRRMHHETEAGKMNEDVAGNQFEELLPVVEREIARLPARQREVLVLKYYEGLSGLQIATQIQRSERTVMYDITRGISNLRLRLKHAGLDMPADQLDSRLGSTALLLPVPAILMGRLAELAGGSGVAGGAAELAEGMLRSMLWTRIRTATAIAASVVIVGGIGVAVAQVAAGGPNGGSPAASRNATNPPAVLAIEAKPAPVNQYNGMQEREEIFEFAEKPKVTKTADKWVITFASKGNCDATVAILDKGGKILRHLASGVLGANAPHPFQQGSLAQKIEWDGLTDDFKKASSGCRVKVGLGLQARFERNIWFDPYDTVETKWADRTGKVFSGKDADGNWLVLAGVHFQIGFFSPFGRVYDKNGKYLRTFWPPQAKDLEKSNACKLLTTKWGDQSPYLGSYSFNTINGKLDSNAILAFAGATDIKEGRPAEVPRATVEPFAHMWRPHDMAVDTVNERIVVRGRMFDGKTGEPLPGNMGGGGADLAFGWDGLLYTTEDTGPMRIRRQEFPGGKPVPFKENADKDGKLITGAFGNGRGFNDGLDIAPDGKIIVGVASTILDGEPFTSPKATQLWAMGAGGFYFSRVTKSLELGLKIIPEKGPGGTGGGRIVSIFDGNGKLIANNAVQGGSVGHGVFMDRDGSIYMAMGAMLPSGQRTLDGLKDGPAFPFGSGGASIVKFRGLGGKYPVGEIFWSGKGGLPNDFGASKPGQPPKDATGIQLEFEHHGRWPQLVAVGGLWAYGGMSNMSGDQCNCAFARFHLDRWARSWVPANQVCSVMVIDSNGNRVMRIGRYGNVTDTEEDINTKKGDGIRFAHVRGVLASDTALYAHDYPNRRILKAALFYAAEEIVPAP
ncbi:MAG: hypothetical protein C0404_14370 [Verrucomicrobia bacterium]|nr:hypothetical protein [Verrucomicrobiota bacterium]